MNRNEVRILIVEDDEGHAGLIRRAFLKADMASRMTLVDSIASARELLARGEFDLVLADLVLPDGRAIELLAPGEDRQWPVVIMTSHGDEVAAVEAMKAGALDYLVKSQSAFAELPRTSETILRRWQAMVQRRQAEEALRKNEEQFRTLIENIPGVVYRCDLESPWRMQHMSEAVLQLTGYPLSEFIGPEVKAYGELILEEDRNYVIDGVKAAITCRGPFDLEYRIKHADGSLRWVFERGRAICDEGGRPVCLDGVMFDITEHKKAEEELARAKRAAESANRAKSEFLANMSHEIRTPMTSILGFADMLMSFDFPPHERREYLATIRRNAENLLTVINDILDLSKIEAERLDLELLECSPWEVIDDVFTLMADRARSKGLRLELDHEYPLPAFVRTDPTRLRQILVNLVGNAVKFTEEGEIRVSARCEPAEVSQRKLSITVTDTGIGMTAAQIERLFQPFTQGDMSTTRRFGGTGLGLAISQRLAAMLGGRIDVESRLDRGSSFRLTIDPGPLDEVTWLNGPPAAGHVREPKDTAPARQISGRVLLAEDSADVQALISATLCRMGLEVETAANGREAFCRAMAAKDRGTPFDLILMDIQMPEWDGYQATQRLRAAGYTDRIVALTAHVMRGDRQKCLDAGCDDYLPKPINSNDLAESVSGFLKDSNVKQPEVCQATAELPESAGGVLGSKYFTEGDRKKLLQGFVDGLTERIDGIESSLANHDVDSLIRIAHALHGAAGLYGYEKLAKTALEVEEQARDGASLTQVETAARQLADLCRAAQEQFQTT